MSRDYFRRRMRVKDHVEALLLLLTALASVQFAARSYHFDRPAVMLVALAAAVLSARALRRRVLRGDVIRTDDHLAFFDGEWRRWPNALLTSVVVKGEGLEVNSLRGERRFAFADYRDAEGLRAVALEPKARGTSGWQSYVLAVLPVFLIAFGGWRVAAERTNRFRNLLATPPPAYLDLRLALAPVVEGGGELACAAQRQLMERADAELREQERERHSAALRQCRSASSND